MERGLDKTEGIGSTLIIPIKWDGRVEMRTAVNGFLPRVQFSLSLINNI